MVYLIFGDAFTFPEGDASTNRVFSYANGFIENRLDVSIVCFRNDNRAIYYGEIDRVKYYNLVAVDRDQLFVPQMAEYS